MDYSNNINIVEVLSNAPDYAIMRKSVDFPNYYRGSDIDLLVADIEDWIFYLEVTLKQYRGTVNHYAITDTHYQVDFYKSGFDIKFDLYSFYISHEFTQQAWINRVVNGVTELSVHYNRLSKCYEATKYGKKKYYEYIRFEDLLSDYI